MRKLSTIGKMTFWVGCIFAVLGILGLFHVFLLSKDTSASISYILIGIMLISGSFLYTKKKGSEKP
jgi:LPXTG-motif cell wall-anchored protein